MLGKIASAVEPSIRETSVRQHLKTSLPGVSFGLPGLIALSVAAVVDRVSPAAIFVPTKSGATARSLARFRFPVWIVAVSRHERTCQRLLLSYGVQPKCETEHPEDWKSYAKGWLQKNGLAGNLVVVIEGPSTNHPEGNQRMEIMDLDNSGQLRPSVT
jgi:pyruvate kinase